LEGHEDWFVSNRVVITGKKIGQFKCSGPGKTILHDNQYFTRSGDVQECGMSLVDWQQNATGNDVKSTVERIPSDETIIAWGKDVLGQKEMLGQHLFHRLEARCRRQLDSRNKLEE